MSLQWKFLTTENFRTKEKNQSGVALAHYYLYVAPSLIVVKLDLINAHFFSSLK